MGGNALKNTTTRRYAAAEYHALCLNVVRKLREAFDDDKYHISVIKSYADKETFGDMDVLIAPVAGQPVIGADVYEEAVRTMFGPHELVRNSHVTSFDVLGLQVDLIVCKPDEYETCVNYFAYNDLGNLLGRLANAIGLKLGHAGLSYVWRVGTHVFDEKVLTTDWALILEVLGLDAARYNAGFQTRTDIFDFVSSSKLFSPEIYLLKNRNNRDRARDRKRETYQQFLIYCENKFPDYAVPMWMTMTSAEHLPALFELIPGFAATYARVQSNYNDALRAREHFNGALVSEWTGLRERELGTFMRWLRHVRGFDHAQVVTLNAAEVIKLVVKEEYARYSATPAAELQAQLDAASVKHHASTQGNAE